MKKSFSIFSNTSNKPKAAEEHKVTISFHNQNNTLSFGDTTQVLGEVVGYMTNEFSYSSTGNYKNVWDLAWDGNSMPAKVLSDESQRNFFNYGYATKKMYSNGEAPSINISFTCYAGEDNVNENSMAAYDKTTQSSSSNNPVHIAKMLIAATLPQVSTSNAFLNTNIGEQAGGIIEGAGKIISTIPPAAKAFGEGVMAGKPLEGFVNTVTTLAEGITDTITSHKPPVCELTIGNIFKKDMMVVRKVDVTMSKEYLGKGIPLYAKFDVTFESLFNAANLYGEDSNNDKEKIFGSGLIVTKGASRVNFSSGYGARSNGSPHSSNLDPNMRPNP